MIYERECVICGKPYKSTHNMKKTCSFECSLKLSDLAKARYLEKAKAKREAERKTYLKKCIICGNVFRTSNTRQRTCSQECSKEHNRNQSREHARNRKYQPKPNNDEKKVIKSRKATNIPSVSEIAAEANRLGMSYGKYVAMQALKAVSV